MKKSMVIVLILVLACTMAFAAGKKITIGRYGTYDTKIEYFVAMEQGVKDYCAKMGYDVIVHDEKSDETAMVSGLLDLINQGIDALLISPFKPEALAQLHPGKPEKNSVHHPEHRQRQWRIPL